ncbi:TonB-dependent receptor domain-containing protein [Echinimonas agarilytica]|uniref:TonB-dependent receptor n=1 Tax=Echinimonas agarilytica TaxID=1215918 RepID=A0AA41WAD8_9GAMM|nr:TonB-dependent receptor [Echinimonas agarilytica]MCM2681148.1 TonB-dependent receptor [Echinimonas agarilytica]
MKKNTLYVAIATALLSAPVCAEETETMVITANRVEQNKFDVMASVDVITREDIQLIQPVSVVDLLNRTSGVTFVQQGGAANTTSIFMRGTNSNQVLILIDGARVGSATLGQKSIQDLSPTQIDRIEVVKGPRAALYGSDAIGGVIQIFTRDLAPNQFNLGGGYGSNNTAQFDAAGGFELFGSRNTMSITGQKSDGFSVTDAEPDDDGYERGAVSLKGDYQVGKVLSFDWMGLIEKGDYDFDGGFENQKDYRNHLVQIGTTADLGQTILRLEIGQSEDEQNGYGNGIGKGDGSLYQTTINQLSANVTHSINDDFTVILGADLQDQEVDSSDPIAVDERTVEGYYAGLTGEVGQFLAEAAVRYDDIEHVDSETTYNLSAGYKFSPNWLVSLNYGTGFKAPSFNDLYSPWGGNQDLVPETSDTVELLLKGNLDLVSIEFAAYNTNIDDLIEWAPIAPGNPNWTPTNLSSAEIKGIDLTLSTSLFDIEHQLTATLLDAENKTTKEDLIRRPSQKFTYAASYAYNQWNVSGDLSYNSDAEDSYGAKLHSYSLLNVFAGYEFDNNFTVRAYGRNMLDKDYSGAIGYNTAGREVGLTVTLQNY